MRTNNKYKLLVTLFSLFLIWTGCQESKTNKDYTEKTITGISVLEDEEPILTFYTVDSLLFGQLYENDDVFAVYRLPSLEKVGRIGKIGIGPDEWKGPNYSNHYVKDENGTSIWINDGISGKLLLVNVDESLSKGKPILLDSISLHPKYNLNQHTFLLDEKTIIGNSGYLSTEAVRLQKLDLSSNEMEKSDLVPEVDGIEQAPTEYKYQTYFDYLALKPDKSLLVSVMININRIDVFNTELEVVATFEEPSDYTSLSAKNINDLNTGRLFYRDVHATDNYIYALRTKGFLKDSFQKDHESEILIFDWSLNLLEKITVSDYLISIALDEKNGTLYGVDFYNEKYLKYQLNEIFHPSKH